MTTSPTSPPEPDENRSSLADQFNHLSIWHFSAAVTAVVAIAALVALLGGNIAAAEVLFIMFIGLALVTAVLRIVGI